MEKKLRAANKADIFFWVRSLPWHGWVDVLPPLPKDADENDDAVVDFDSDEHGGTIELHFNW
ncbi:MAG: hypothetical protein O2854_02560 [Chloroflexi bacterium]|nr:hypothetical protein [Chloroflexota bacterium]